MVLKFTNRRVSFERVGPQLFGELIKNSSEIKIKIEVSGTASPPTPLL